LSLSALRGAVVVSDFDPASRPRLAAGTPDEVDAATAAQSHLVQIHDHLRAELRQMQDAIAAVCSGVGDASIARNLINRMTMRQNYWSVGAFCAAYCRILTVHHTIEDQSLFTELGRSDGTLAPVLERLSEEHEIIADLLERLDAALVALVGPTPTPEDSVAAQSAVSELSEVLASHLTYEEEELVGPLARHPGLRPHPDQPSARCRRLRCVDRKAPMRFTAIRVAVVALTAASCASASMTPNAPRVAASATHVVRVSAHGLPHGSRLAFVSSGQLYVLRGSHDQTQARRIALPAGERAVAPAWSHDHRWLAFLVSRRRSYFAGSVRTLWLARADGRSAHPVLRHVNRMSWSPTADVLAVDQVGSRADPSGRARLLRPGHPSSQIHGLADAVGWSPNGRQLAFTAIQRPRQGLFYGLLGTLDANGRHRVVRYRSRENLMLLRGWTSDGHSVLAWADAQGSASLAADGLPLLAISTATGTASRLARTLTDPAFVSTSPQTTDIAVAAGGDRELADHKQIRLCRPTGGCQSLPHGTPRFTTLDPALSPAEHELGFVHAALNPPHTTAAPYAQRSIQAWYRTRTLWTYGYTGGNPQRLRRAGNGVASPQWSRDGCSILYVRDDALWLVDATGRRPARRIAGPLFSGRWPNYYGYIDWPDQFAWTG
jgi:Tol biopolymer transport system component